MRPPRPSSMVEIACQSAHHFRFFFGVKLRIFLHILVPKKCRVLQLAIRGTFPGLNWVSVPPKLPFVFQHQSRLCVRDAFFANFFWCQTSDFFAYFGSQKVPRVATCNSRHFSGFKLGIRPSKVALRVPVSTNGLMSETFVLEVILEVHLRWSIGERCTNMCCIK